MSNYNNFPILSAEEAALFIKDKFTVGFSAFTAAGSAKAVPTAIAKQAKALHTNGNEYKINVVSGASNCESLDGVLAEADAVNYRHGYQSSKFMRAKINEEKINFVDIHLSQLPRIVSRGGLGKINVAVIEATEITSDGKVYLSTSIGISPTLLRVADKVIIELNQYHSKRLSEMTDIVELKNPPMQDLFSILTPLDKVGKPYAEVDPKKILGIVNTNLPDEVPDFSASNELSQAISNNVVNFLLNEISSGKLPKSFLPIQSGVGNIGNAVMNGLGSHPDLPPFMMYTEVLQDSLVKLMEDEKLIGASTCALTITPKSLEKIYSNMDYFAKKIVLRPQSISNSPIFASKLGVIAINTALEADIYGNINSTHVLGTKMMNGIGGSADFARNAYLSIFVCPAIAKQGKISAIVPMCTHVDSSEHSVDIIITDRGVADLRAKSPKDRAMEIIKNCVHPAYKNYLMNYFNALPANHIRHDLAKCFELHQNLIKHGSMLPELNI
ncbi:MAG TPA: succinate CoA transferase [Victivallales bacterium]|nr:succinate CoA transferase [Victivallales bacterium]